MGQQPGGIVENLNKLRKLLVEQRRDLVATLIKGKPPKSGAALDDIRKALRAVDDAIKEEQKAAKPTPSPTSERYSEEQDE